jgi:hypothetical protein
MSYAYLHLFIGILMVCCGTVLICIAYGELQS